MGSHNSLDELKELIAALLRDVCLNHGVVFTARAQKLTYRKICKRMDMEGVSFLTKTLPALGKAFDKALAGEEPMNAVAHGFKPMRDSQLPIFMGELFSQVLHNDGTVLPDPCKTSVRSIRQLLFLFYKYQLPYSAATEQKVLDKFVRTEREISMYEERFAYLETLIQSHAAVIPKWSNPLHEVTLLRRARHRLNRLFEHFDGQNILPRHGPGAVSTRERLWAKYQWRNICRRITDQYPLDAFFRASGGHVCDTYQSLNAITDRESSARVILVPKDSRGPRLISCEPVDFQWVQQGLREAIVDRIESHPLTRENVFFTDQAPNQRGALLGSATGRYATLDLNEASDRVSLGLVRLLMPSHVYTYLESTRSLATVLPDGTEITLSKFAPMGSATCFPVMALTIWALLTAGAPDKDTRERILVYGDDVVVPTAYAADAMNILEHFGLKINRAKSCTKGHFRESCGVDAFKGCDVTPVKLKTVWSSKPLPGPYAAWVAYANQFWRRGYLNLYDTIVQWLFRVYGVVPGRTEHNAPIALEELPAASRVPRSRYNHNLQKREWLVWDVVPVHVKHTMNGWDMLLRYFTEAASKPIPQSSPEQQVTTNIRSFAADQYTERGASILALRWR